MIRPPSRRTALFTLPMILCCTTAFAAPTIVPYAGYLTDADGQAYEGGADVMAALYPCAQAGDGTCDLVYEAPTFLGLTVTGGVLAFELGAEADSALSEVLTEGEDLWLEIAVRLDGAATWTLLEPRHALLSVPYAVNAHDADRLGGMDAADYATAAEIAAHVSLEQIQEAGHLTEDQLAEAGYVTSVTLANYVQQSDLDDYTPTTALAASYPTFDAMQTTLGQYALNSALNAYVQEEELVDQLGNYVSTSGLDAAIAAQLTGLATNADLTSAVAGLLDQSTLDSALAGYVETSGLDAAITAHLTGYATTAGLNAALSGYVETDELENYVTVTAHNAALAPLALKSEAYTDEDAVEAVAEEGYALSTDIPSHDFTTETSTASITLSSNLTEDKTITLSFEVAPKIAKRHVRVDIQVRTELSVDYMNYTAPPNSVASEVTHTVYLDSGFADAPLYTDRLIQSPPREEGDSVTKGDMKQYSYLLELSDAEIIDGANVQIDLTAKCYAVPPKTNIGCSAYASLERVTISGF